MSNETKNIDGANVFSPSLRKKIVLSKSSQDVNKDDILKKYLKDDISKSTQSSTGIKVFSEDVNYDANSNSNQKQKPMKSEEEAKKIAMLANYSPLENTSKANLDIIRGTKPSVSAASMLAKVDVAKHDSEALSKVSAKSNKSDKKRTKSNESRESFNGDLTDLQDSEIYGEFDGKKNTDNNSGEVEVKINFDTNYEEPETDVVETFNDNLKKDARDDKVIKKILNDFEYEEFDSEEDIKNLEFGKKLREMIEGMRDDKHEESLLLDADEASKDERKPQRKFSQRFNKPMRQKKTGQQYAFLKKIVDVYDFITVENLAKKMSIKVKQVQKVLQGFGVDAIDSSEIDSETAELVVTELGHEFRKLKSSTDVASIDESRRIDLKRIAPVVTIMGHVDHGKTSLLDAIRKTDVALKESGGITQHIGAYRVQLESGDCISFIDTPGHEAFTAMRAMGSEVTNIVVLVVAADDGIMQQTIEAIGHAKAAETPIIVAINKIDAPGANIERVKNELLQHNLISESLGGDVMVVPVSAKQKTNIDKLLEAILLQAEVLDLKADFNAKSVGVVLEASIDKKTGVMATLLVQNGVLKKSSIVVTGKSFGKVRVIMDDKGKQIDSAEPSLPVQVMGLDSVPIAGDKFYVVDNEKLAKQIVDYKKKKELDSKNVKRSIIFGDDGRKMINLIIKSDVQGTNEAIKTSIEKISEPGVDIKIVYTGVGEVTESDVLLAKANSGVVLSFKTKVDSKASDYASKNNIPIKTYSVIYELIDEARRLALLTIEPEYEEEKIGEVEVRNVFDLSKQGKVAGCYVVKGIVKQRSVVKIVRDGSVIADSKISTLKRFKENAKEVNQGFECGIQCESFEAYKEKDILEIYEIKEKVR